MNAPVGPADALGALRASVARRIVGKDAVIDLALVCVLAGGHLLLEDVPGVGKTSLGLALARALGGQFRRVQFTSDLLPSDIVGATILDPRTGAFSFRHGPIFANVVLADEINRTTPRTQSALLEAMNEGQVSVDGETLALPDPFLVIATQNPHEYQGTWPLPDSQLDRFLVRASMGYPSRDAERAILRGEARDAEVAAIAPDDLAALRREVAAVTIHAELEEYILDLVAATRSAPSLARGVSTRGLEALVRACRAYARLRGRDYLIPEDVRAMAVPVLAHRVLARADVGADAAGAAIREVMAGLAPPV